MSKRSKIITSIFLILEFILYMLILFSNNGNIVKLSSFGSIVLCFIYSLYGVNKSNALFSLGLLCTVMADLCLVMCDPIERLGGMIFFLIAQSLYAYKLFIVNKSKLFISLRFVLIAVVEVVGFIVLKENTDMLACISLAYYVMLFINIVESFKDFKVNKFLPIGFVLFILCDTVIGLQVMSKLYLNLKEGSLIYNIVFTNFNLAWLFYLPSQVLISISSKSKLMH